MARDLTRDRSTAENHMAKQATPKKQKLDQADVHELGVDDPVIIDSAEASGTERPEASNTDEWPDFDPLFLLPSTSPAPRFPVKALPVNLRSLVVDFAEARLLNVDYVAGSILTACSGAIGNRARLLNFDGETEPLAVFTGLIGPPSVGKSLGIAVVERPLLAIDQEMQKAHGLMLKGADHSFLEKFDRKLRETVARRLLLEGIPLENETSGGDGVVAAPGIILSEFSGAGLLDELRTGIDGRMMLSHELSGALAFASNQGLRSRGLILKGYDGKPHVVRTKSEGKVFIPALQVSILGATQPSRLRSLLGDAHDGLAARTWWIYPDVEPRVQLPRAPGSVERLSALLTHLVAIVPACTRECYSALVPLAAETREPLESAEQRWLQLRALTDGLYRDFVGRASQHATRLAALLAIAEHMAAGGEGLPLSIDAGSVEAAVDIVEGYLLPMAERVLSEASAPKDGDAARLARFLARGGKSAINVRADVLRAAGSPVRDAQNAAEALEELRRRNVIRPVKRGAAQLGRPAQVFEVHPALLARQWKV
jgi:hypothetical protein